MSLAALLVQLHHRFIRIHPFDDGNGRMMRLLMNGMVELGNDEGSA